jgi:hypothetical protein
MSQALAHAPETPALDGHVMNDSGFMSFSMQVQQFQKHLTDMQRNVLNHTFSHPKRDRGFCYVLAHCKQDHTGLKMSDLRGDARFQLHQLLTRVMSSQGYLKFLSVMQRERLLEEMEDASRRYPETFTATAGETGLAWKTPLKRNYNDYYIAFFGDLKQGEKWGMRLEGHHYSLNLTIDARTKPITISATPLFMGVSPMVVPAPPKQTPQLYPRWYDSEGHHLMATESQLSKAIITAIDPDHREKAQWPTWPGPTLAGSIDQVPPLAGKTDGDDNVYGFHIKKGDKKFKALITELFIEYLGVQRVTGIDQKQLTKELHRSGKIYWKGDFVAPMGKFYLRVESDRYLFELLQNDLWSVDSEHASNHIHSSLRDLKADWDHDRLGEHLARFHNHKLVGKWETLPAIRMKGQAPKGIVILAHSSDSKGENMLRWGNFVAQLGFDAIIVDSFTPRHYENRKDVGWDAAVTDQSR